MMQNIRVLKLTYFLITLPFFLFSQEINLPIDCSVNWRGAAEGICAGENFSLIPFDQNDDGTIEILAQARPDHLDRSYWYILKYDDINNTYYQTYVSELYDQRIFKLLLIENLDGSKELIYSQNRIVYVFDLDNLVLKQSVELPDFLFLSGVRQILFEDINNDGEKELIFGESRQMVVLNKDDLSINQIIEFESDVFDVGNVDEDSNLEVVFGSGEVWELIDKDFNLDFSFALQTTEKADAIKLIDLNGDFLEEALIGGDRNFNCYDIQNNMNLGSYFESQGINSFDSKDYNLDGKLDLVYSDIFGDVYVYDLISGDLIWHLNSSFEENRVLSYAIEDFDSDGEMEILHSTGCFGVSSNLIFYDLNSKKLEYKTQHKDGPYYTIEIVDIDGDAQTEIITSSITSNEGRDAGVIQIFDAETRLLEFEHQNEEFVSDRFRIYDLEIFDYQDDNDLDIVIGGSSGSDSKIFIIDGKTLELEASRRIPVFEIVGSDALLLHLSDMNQDGVEDIIIATERDVGIVNGIDLELIWSSGDFLEFSFPTSLFSSNIKEGPSEEIILCKNNIYVFDGDNFFFVEKSDQSGYTTAAVHDRNNDGSLEIYAGTNQGYLHILDPQTLEIIEEHKISDNFINAIQFYDANFDGSDEIVCTSMNRLFFVDQRNWNVLESQELAPTLGVIDGMKFLNDANNEMDIIVSNAYGFMSISSGCMECLWFDPQINISNPTCGDRNGTISAIKDGEYIQIDSHGQDSTFTGLSAGLYEVTIGNEEGCRLIRQVELVEENLSINLQASPVSCSSENSGNASIEIIEGKFPYDIEWSNGIDELENNNLIVGEYFVKVEDANGCVVFDTIDIEQAKIETSLEVQSASCLNVNNGSALVTVLEGIQPFTYSWNGEMGDGINNMLLTGVNQVEIIDGNQCSSIHEFTIDTLNLLSTVQQTNPDCNGQSTGVGQVFVQSDAADYFVQWDNGFIGEIQEDLTQGVYKITVSDSNGCVVENEISIEEQFFEIEFMINEPSCFGLNDGSIEIIVDSNELDSIGWSNGTNALINDQLVADDYSVLVSSKNGCLIESNFTLDEPSEIEIQLSANNDSSNDTIPSGSILSTVSGGIEPYSYLWSNGEMSPDLFNLPAGIYNLSVTDANDCVVTNSIEILLMTNVNTLLAEKIKIHPNPTSSIVQLESPFKIEEIYIYDSSGVPVTCDINSMSSNRYTIILDTKSAGVYFVKIFSNDSIFVKKLILINDY